MLQPQWARARRNTPVHRRPQPPPCGPSGPLDQNCSALGLCTGHTRKVVSCLLLCLPVNGRESFTASWNCFGALLVPVSGALFCIGHTWIHPFLELLLFLFSCLFVRLSNLRFLLHPYPHFQKLPVTSRQSHNHCHVLPSLSSVPITALRHSPTIP